MFGTLKPIFMKKFKSNHLVIAVLICFTALISYSQDKLQYEPSIDPLVKGEEYLNEGEYEKAFEQFDQVHEGDSLFFRFAVHMKMAALNNLERFEKVKEIGDKYWYFRHDLPTEFYLNYGTALDNLEEYDKAQEMYKSILEEYPMNYSLWYNLGVSYSLEEDYEMAYETYKKTIKINPFYDRVHFAMAQLAFREQQTSKGLLAMGRYLMHSITRRNNFPQLRLADYMSSAKYWTDEDFQGSTGLDLDGNDSFETIDQLVHNYVALRDKYKTPSKFEYPYVKQLHLIASQLKEQSSGADDYWFETYGKFYIEMLQEDQFEGFTYLISSYIENEKMQKTVERKDKDLVKAYEWAVDYLETKNETVDLSFIGFGETKVSRSGEMKYIELIGDFELINGGSDLKGDVTFYNGEGRKSAEGTFNSNGNKEGVWKYYHSNGRLKERQTMKDGEGADTSYTYYQNGLLNLKIPFKEGIPDGTVSVYTDGVLKRTLPYKDGGLSTGKYTEYHPIGTVNIEYQMTDGKANGEFKSYYATGELYRKGTFKDGDLHGERITYFRSGEVSYKEQFEEGESEGPYLSYFRDGQLQAKGQFKDGNKTGKWEYFYRNGKKQSVQSFDDRGKENGLETRYSEGGWKTSEHSYNKGIVDAYKFFNEKGEILSEGERQGGDLQYVSYFENGVKSAEGVINKEGRHGKWKFYYANGALESIQNYEDGVRKGVYEKYFPNGDLEVKYEFNEEGVSEGYYRNYFRNGDLFRQGYLLESDRDGPWESYYRNGKPSRKSFNSGFELQGFYTYYDVKGKPTRSTYYKDGLDKFDIYYDTAGVAFDTIFSKPGERVEELRRCADCSPFMEVDIFNDRYHGDQLFFFPDGSKEAEGPVFNGSKHGKWKTYHPNGKVASEGEYVDGDMHGVWKYYAKEGYLRKKVNYVYGDLNGAYENYDEDGNIIYAANYFYGELHGESKFYVGNKSDHSRFYEYGYIKNYKFINKEGEEVVKDMKNETAKITTYWSNGKKARVYEIDRGWFQGPYLKYFDNGQIAEEQTYKDDLLEGAYKEYYRNGQLMIEGNYKEGDREGVFVTYYENGKKKAEEPYVHDELYGKATYYNEDGSVSSVIQYVNGNIITIEKK